MRTTCLFIVATVGNDRFPIKSGLDKEANVHHDWLVRFITSSKIILIKTIQTSQNLMTLFCIIYNFCMLFVFDNLGPYIDRHKMG